MTFFCFLMWSRRFTKMVEEALAEIEQHKYKQEGIFKEGSLGYVVSKVKYLSNGVL